MATCLIQLSTPNLSKSFLCRGVVDTAAAASFVSYRVLSNLDILPTPYEVTISSISRSPSTSRGLVNLTILNRHGNLLCSSHSFIVVDRISYCTTPSSPISKSEFSTIPEVELADPHLGIPAFLDCIIGVDLAARVISGPPVSVNHNLYFIPSFFGRLLIGSAAIKNFHLPDNAMSVNYTTSFPDRTSEELSDHQLSALVERFWKIEDIPAPHTRLSPLETDCEALFVHTTKRLPTGRYQVRLPFIKPYMSIELGDSFQRAYACFLSLERRFSRDPHLHSLYETFMQDYLDQGHMIEANGPISYLIPHHGIFKNKGEPDKIRVVFNASSPTSNGVSLNDLLFQGPKLQPLISDILTLFRLFPYVITCDIKQMFRQIAIDPADYQYQCILWRAEPSQPLKTYYLTTVTYGTRSAPYLALRVLKQLAIDEATHFPDAAKIVLNNTYVDDISIGALTIPEVLKLKESVINLLSKGGFTLSKWISNHPSLVNTETLPENGSNCSTYRILGLNWSPQTDFLSLSLDFKLRKGPVTKRSVLSMIAQIYDPNGWYTPFTLKAKSFLQTLWISKLSWDAPLTPELLGSWQELLKQFPQLEQIELPRSIIKQGCSEFHLHGFSDASKYGSSAVLYLAPLKSDLKPVLLTARSRVAPLKIQTIPRLELIGAHMLAELSSHFTTLLAPYISISHVSLWTDSQITLDWIHTPPHQLKTFEANRVARILELSQLSSWKHVPSSLNPADLASRGLSAESLSLSENWWTGPSWLPNHLPVLASSVLPTASRNFSDCSTWIKLFSIVRIVISWLPLERRIKLTPFLAITRMIQIDSMSDVFHALQMKRPLPIQLRRLNPFVDSLGIIRVGGRLSNSPYIDIRHPILWPKNHFAVKLFITHAHQVLLHAGFSQLQYYISNKCWVLGLRQLIRSVIFSCNTCFRAKPRNSTPIMGSLPNPRVVASLPFLHTGVDCAGPFTIRASSLRKAVTLKVYVCVFVCFSTKAVHLEVAHSLSSIEFLDVFKRFISRRGQPEAIYCDNGTNFVGAARILARQLKELLTGTETNPFKQYFQLNPITFNFNPPSAPHMGGLWERAVGLMKSHLKKTLKEQNPVLATFQSLIIQIEGILNSRPMMAQSRDPNDLEALTPAHFLVGRSLILPPENTSSPTDVSMKQYTVLRQYLASFWNRWRREYLPTLQPRVKWQTHSPNLVIDDLVLIDEPNVSASYWPLGRVIQLFPDQDGIVRKVQIRTQNGLLLRPVVKLFRLPNQ